MKTIAAGTIVEIDDGTYRIGVIRGTGARRDPDARLLDDQFTFGYMVSERYLSGTTWEFKTDSRWVAPEHVTELHADDVPTAAGLCDGCGVPILLDQAGTWVHHGSPEDVRAQPVTPAQRRWLTRNDVLPRDEAYALAEQRMRKPHDVRPAHRTVALANEWDIDAATDREYPILLPRTIGA